MNRSPTRRFWSRRLRTRLMIIGVANGVAVLGMCGVLLYYGLLASIKVWIGSSASSRVGYPLIG